ncbi:MAG TPA: PDZ domain-containing protein [Pirellulales bacterium]|nr:PDZ domain-containing protein [Pirellulales bacterium]
MARKSAVCWIAAGAIIAAGLAARVHGDEPEKPVAVDPIEWSKPKRPPAFREVLKPDDYARQFEQAAAKIDIPALVKADRQVVGSWIVDVTPNSPAAKIGLQPGDLITKLDGEQLWGSEWHRRDDRPQTMTYVTKDGQTKEATIQPGPVGFNTRFLWRPESEYLRRSARAPHWDKEVLVGILERSTNPDLAETALHRAVAAGLVPDQLLDGVGAEIAYSQGRNEAAMDFVWSALVDHRTKSKGQLNPELLYRVAIANYKLDVAAAVLRDYHDQFRGQPDPEMLDRLAKMHRARPDTERCLPEPIEQAANLRRLNLTPILEPANEWTAKEFKDFLKGRTSFMLSLPSSYFNFLAYKPASPVRDVEAVWKMTIRYTDNKPTDYAQIVQLWLADEATTVAGNSSPLIGEARAPNLLFLAFTGDPNLPSQDIEFSHSGITGTDAYCEDHSVRLDGKQVIEVRLLRLGGEGEIFVNGHRVLYVPIDPAVGNVGFAMKIVGMTVDVKDFRISQLIPKAVVHQAADGGISLDAVDANCHGDQVRYEMDADKKCIGYWSNQQDWIDWDVQVDRPGKFQVAVSSSCPNDLAGANYGVSAGPEKDASVTGVVKPTGDWTVFKADKLGLIEIAKPGRITIAVRPTTKPNSHVMNLRKIELQPAK